MGFVLEVDTPAIVAIRTEDGNVINATPTLASGAGGISQLTGDVLAGPGLGVQGATVVKASGGIAGVFQVVDPMSANTTAGTPSTAGSVNIPNGGGGLSSFGTGPGLDITLARANGAVAQYAVDGNNTQVVIGGAATALNDNLATNPGHCRMRFAGVTEFDLDMAVANAPFPTLTLGDGAGGAVVFRSHPGAAAGAGGDVLAMQGGKGTAGAADGGAGGTISITGGAGAAGAAAHNGGAGGVVGVVGGNGAAKGAGGATDGAGGIVQMICGVPGGAAGALASSQMFAGSGTAGAPQDDLMLEIAALSTTKRCVSLCQTGIPAAVGITATQLPANTGDGIIFIWAAQTNPSANPSAAGYILYVDSATKALKGRGSAGTVVTIGAADPHCPVCGHDFMTEHENGGEYLSVCLHCLADHLGAQPWIVRKSPPAKPPTPEPQPVGAAPLRTALPSPVHP
jgi:hypothetical protein